MGKNGRSQAIKEVTTHKYADTWQITAKIEKDGKSSIASASLSIATNVPDGLMFNGKLFGVRTHWFFNRLIVPEDFRNLGIGADLLHKIEVRTDFPVLNYPNYYGSRINVKTGKEDNGKWYLDWLESRGWAPNQDRKVFLFNPMPSLDEEDDDEEIDWDE
jgi:hypothetical protein